MKIHLLCSILQFGINSIYKKNKSCLRICFLFSQIYFSSFSVPNLPEFHTALLWLNYHKEIESNEIIERARSMLPKDKEIQQVWEASGVRGLSEQNIEKCPQIEQSDKNEVVQSEINQQNDLQIQSNELYEKIKNERDPKKINNFYNILLKKGDDPFKAALSYFNFLVPSQLDKARRLMGWAIKKYKQMDHGPIKDGDKDRFDEFETRIKISFDKLLTSYITHNLNYELPVRKLLKMRLSHNPYDRRSWLDLIEYEEKRMELERVEFLFKNCIGFVNLDDEKKKRQYDSIQSTNKT